MKMTAARSQRMMLHGITFISWGLCLLFPLLLQSQNCNPQGNWMGAIEGRGGSLRLGMHLDCSNKVCTGYFTSPDQTSDSFNIDAATLSGDTLIVKCKKLSAKYKAVFNAGCDTLKGQWNQAGEIAFAMHRVEVLPVMERPQEPKPPFPYATEDVTFPNKKGKFSLAGTLSVPAGTGPFPAVIMISGSGPQDRNETLLGHKPFWVIADSLTRAGIAVLRYDDRGVGVSGGDFQKATSYDFATDALAAFDYLQTRNEIDPSCIGLIGHSEGGMIAPIVAAKNSKVAFIILLAGPGTTGKQILMDQAELIARADSTPESEIALNRTILEKIYGLIEKEGYSKELSGSLKELMKREAENMTSEQKEASGLTDANINRSVSLICTKWFVEFVRFDPQPWLKKVSCPVLALNGEKDLQVPCAQNLTAIEKALKSGKCKQYKTMAFPGLNHLFQHCTTCQISEYARISETFSPEVLHVMIDWINTQCKK